MLADLLSSVGFALLNELDRLRAASVEMLVIPTVPIADVFSLEAVVLDLAKKGVVFGTAIETREQSLL